MNLGKDLSEQKRKSFVSVAMQESPDKTLLQRIDSLAYSQMCQYMDIAPSFTKKEDITKPPYISRLSPDDFEQIAESGGFTGDWLEGFSDVVYPFIDYIVIPLPKNLNKIDMVQIYKNKHGEVISNKGDINGNSPYHKIPPEMILLGYMEEGLFTLVLALTHDEWNYRDCSFHDIIERTETIAKNIKVPHIPAQVNGEILNGIPYLIFDLDSVDEEYGTSHIGNIWKVV